MNKNIRETTLIRYKVLIDEYDEIVNKTPDIYRMDLSKTYYLRELSKKRKDFTFLTIQFIINKRDEIMRSYNKLVK